MALRPAKDDLYSQCLTSELSPEDSNLGCSREFTSLNFDVYRMTYLKGWKFQLCWPLTGYFTAWAGAGEIRQYVLP